MKTVCTLTNESPRSHKRDFPAGGIYGNEVNHHIKQKSEMGSFR